MTRRSYTLYVLGSISGTLLVVGIGLLVGRVFHKLMENRLKKEIVLVEGSRVFDSWKNSPAPVFMEFFFFNLTNAEDCLTGAKPEVTQIGPYTYREYRYKDNVTMVENGTMVSAYTIKKFVFLREKSVGDPTVDNITTVNIPCWAVMEKMKGSWYRTIVSMFMKNLGGGVFTSRTVHELLWGYEDAVLEKAASYSPGLDKEFGLMYKKNGSDSGEFIYHTGEQNYLDYGRVKTWKGQSKLTFWTSDESNRIKGSDGSSFHPFLTKDERLYIFTPDLCRSIHMDFEKEVEVKGIPAYRFTPPRSVFASKEENPDNKGFCVSKKECLGTGVLKLSPCRKGAPVVASFPHFYLADEKYVDGIKGMSPNREHHQTFLDLNPSVVIDDASAAKLKKLLVISEVVSNFALFIVGLGGIMHVILIVLLVRAHQKKSSTQEVTSYCPVSVKEKEDPQNGTYIDLTKKVDA
ncbi:Lysosome membrane protein 2 [Oryzias melastigma]|uniref:Lysosome membrane protein 2 n=1 Tax=Oryzias melastigma TaxID=30732 RepID=A0A834CQP5_ORYME|nr:Lysosome membrane protein 2 [Oryzias melastigma]